MASLSLVFDILARDQASPTFRNVGDSAERAGRQGEEASSRLSSGFKLAAGALLGGGLIEGFKSLYDAAAESAKVGRLTEQVVKSTGGAAHVTAQQVGDLATAISNKTGVDDEAIQSGENLLLTFTNVRNEVGKGNDIFNQATSILTDMSVALGQDTSTSAIQLGKALNDPIRGVSALQKVGVSFTESQKEQIRTLVESGHTMEAQKIILAELGKEFGGAAAAASTPFEKLQVQLGNVAEQLGSYLIPAMDAFSGFVGHDLLPIVGDLVDAIGPVLSGAFHVAAGAITAIFGVAQDLAHAFGELPGPLKAAVVAAGAFVLLRGPMAGVLTTIKGLAIVQGLSGSFSAFGQALGYARANGDGLGTVLRSVGSYAGGQLVAGLKRFAAAIGPALGIAAAVYVVSELVSGFKSLTQASDEAKSAAEGLAGSLTLVNDAADRQTVRKAIEGIDGLVTILDRAGVSSETAIAGLLGNARAQDEVTAALNRYKASLPPRGNDPTRSAEGVRQATLAYEELATGYDGAASSARYFGSAAGDAGATTGEAGTAAGDAAQSVGFLGTVFDAAKAAAQRFATRLQDTADAASAARSQVGLLKTALDVLSGDTVDLSQAQADLYAAVDASNGALKDLKGRVLDSSGALNTQSEAGRKAQDVLFGVRDAGNQYIATLEQQGYSTETVLAADANLRKSFIQSARQMGLSQQAAEDLANQILGIPSERETEIKADTQTASQHIGDLVLQMLGIPNRTVTVAADTSSARDTINRLIGDLNSQGFFGVLHFFQGRAAGGVLDGYSPTSTSDNILFRGTAGEFVQPVRAVDHYGIPFMEAVRTGRFPKDIAKSYVGAFAGGGYIPPAGYPDFVGRVALNDSVAQQLQSYQPFAPAAGVSGGINQGIVQAVAAGYGWGAGAQWNALVALINRESGFRNTAQNPTSTAYGIFQFLDSTWGSVGGYKTSDPRLQSIFGLRYIAGRYGSPLGAWGHETQFGWYDQGGLIQPGYTLVANGTGKPETIRNAEQEAALQSGPRTVIYDQRQVHAEVNARQLARQMSEEQRISEFLHG